MLKTRILQLSPLESFVKENSGQWKVVSRTAPGQDYCWVVVNGNEPKIGAAPSVVISDTDWPITADQWSNDRPYRAYIPLTPNNDSFPARYWVSNWGFNNRTGCRLTVDAGKLIIRVRDNARLMTQAVLSTYKPKYVIPPSLSLGWLDSRFPTEEALAAKVAEAQRHVLDQYGFIAFNIKRDPTWRTRAALSPLKDMIINTGLTECAYRGCIVNVKKIDLSVMFMLIEDKVPFHYQWFPADVGPFNPRELKAINYDLRESRPEEAPQEEHHIVDLSNTRGCSFYRVSSGGERVAITRKAFKRWAFWCRTKHRKSPSGDVYLLFQDAPHADDSLTPIDMEDIQSSDHNPDDSTVLGMDSLPDYSSDDEGESTELEVQEMLPPGVTPGVTTTALSQSEVDAADAFLSALKGVTITSQQEPQDRAPQQDTVTTSSPPVASPMREDASAPCLPLPAVPCPTRICDTEMEFPPRDEQGMVQDSAPSRKRAISTVSSPSKTRENKRHCHGAGLSSELSASPDATISSPVVIEQPTLQDSTHNVVTVSPAPVPQVLVQLATDLKFTGPPVILPGINFPTTATQRTGKLVTTFRTAVRLVHLRFLNPNASPADFIPTLLRSGAPYRVLSPLGNATPHPLAGQPPYLATRHEYTGLDLEDPGYWESYKRNVEELLGRPYARRFLSLGGIFWRLALQFGDMLDGFCDDMVTPADKGILLGQQSARIGNMLAPLGSLGYSLLNGQTQRSKKSAKPGENSSNRLRQSYRMIQLISGTDPLARTVFGQLGHSVDREPCWDLAQYEATT
ncbi:hypothetical protein EDD22DRAFT_954784 [Suillus occidentalis]|nr:hypothetical protein EDD22DRAFT_954784 [Suillus occidentalis]